SQVADMLGGADEGCSGAPGHFHGVGSEQVVEIPDGCGEPFGNAGEVVLSETNGADCQYHEVGTKPCHPTPEQRRRNRAEPLARARHVEMECLAAEASAGARDGCLGLEWAPGPDNRHTPAVSYRTHAPDATCRRISSRAPAHLGRRVKSPSGNPAARRHRSLALDSPSQHRACRARREGSIRL